MQLMNVANSPERTVASSETLRHWYTGFGTQTMYPNKSFQIFIKLKFKQEFLINSSVQILLKLNHFQKQPPEVFYTENYS